MLVAIVGEYTVICNMLVDYWVYKHCVAFILPSKIKQTVIHNPTNMLATNMLSSKW